MNFAMVRKSFLAFDKVSELDQMGILYQTESFLTACMSLVHKLDKPWSRQWPSFTNTRKELIEMCSPIGHNSTKHFLCPIRSRLRLNFWKWSGESRYPGALSPVMKTFVPPFLPTRMTAPGSPRMQAGRISHFTSRIYPSLVEWRRLSRFPAKMTQVHARALLSVIEKISNSQSLLP